MPAFSNQNNEVTRRRFVRAAAGTCLGVSLVPTLRAKNTETGTNSRGTAKRVIYLFMDGGMSQLDTLDPKPGAASQGPTRAIATATPGIRFSEHLPSLAKQTGKLAVVSSIQSNSGAHETGKHLVRTSYQFRGTITHPSLGAWATRLSEQKPQELPGYVLVTAESRHPGGGFLTAGSVHCASVIPQKVCRICIPGWTKPILIFAMDCPVR